MKNIATTLVLILLLFCFACQNRSAEPTEKGQALSSETLIEINRQLVNKDVNFGVEFARKNAWDFTQLDNGIIFEVIEKGHGIKPIAKDRVSFSYSLRILENDSIVYSSAQKGGLLQFVVDYDEVPSGLNEIAKHLNGGDSLRLILPPHMAYGLLGDGNLIPPRSSLLYLLKLESVQSSN